MYLLSLFVTLFLVSLPVSTAGHRCPIRDVHCNCSQPYYPRCSLQTLYELKSRDLLTYLRRGVHYLSFTFTGNHTFPSGILPYHQFTELVIDGRDLNDVAYHAFAGLERTLRTLRLRYGRFDRIPVSAIMRLQALSHLDMEGNKIRELHQSLRGLKLRGLNLNQNKIRLIRRNLLPWTLEDLGLRKNNLYHLNRALSGNIKDLDISCNHITSLDGELYNLPELHTLDASFNRIERFGVYTFARVHKLRTLRLSNNKIRSLSDGSFTGLRNLGHLDVSVNGLLFVSRGAFRNLEGLKELNISSNGLKSLSEGTMDGLKSLVELDISSNNLRDLKFMPSSFTDGPANIRQWKRLRMRGSGIICDGVNWRIIRRLESSQVHIEGNPCWSSAQPRPYDRS